MLATTDSRLGISFVAMDQPVSYAYNGSGGTIAYRNDSALVSSRLEMWHINC
jgi:hypothetical protein